MNINPILMIPEAQTLDLSLDVAILVGLEPGQGLRPLPLEVLTTSRSSARSPNLVAYLLLLVSRLSTSQLLKQFFVKLLTIRPM